MKRFTMMAVLLCALQAHAAVGVKYLSASDPAEQQARDSIERSAITDKLADLSARYFPFQEDLTVVYGGEDGPLYDMDSNTIQIPYQFYIQTKHYFANNGYTARHGYSAEAGAQDALLHTLLHEAAHAYIANNGIAVLGKEEDAADDFAALMLLAGGVPRGGEIAISAADLFAFSANDAERPEYYQAVEYIDEHSFDLQRYFATLCLVYGSDPERYADLLNEISPDALAERQEFCRMRFDEVAQNWGAYLPDGAL